MDYYLTILVKVLKKKRNFLLIKVLF